MVFGKVKNYAIATLLVASLAGGVACYFLHKNNVYLEEKLLIAEQRIIKAELNLVLVEAQLKKETENRIAAESALTELGTLDEEIYNEKLDPALGDIIRSFNERLQ